MQQLLDRARFIITLQTASMLLMHVQFVTVRFEDNPAGPVRSRRAHCPVY